MLLDRARLNLKLCLKKESPIFNKFRLMNILLSSPHTKYLRKVVFILMRGRLTCSIRSSKTFELLKYQLCLYVVTPDLFIIQCLLNNYRKSAKIGTKFTVF